LHAVLLFRANKEGRKEGKQHAFHVNVANFAASDSDG